jgi:hypothetical protein
MIRPRQPIAYLALALLAAGCGPESPPTAPSTPPVGPALTVEESGIVTSAMLDEVNRQLAAAGAGYRAARAELALASTAPPELASTVFANDRTLQTGVRWVAGDPRRPSGNTLRHYFYAPMAGVNTIGGVQDGRTEVAASFVTWAGRACAPLDFQQAAYDGTFPSAMFGGGDPSVGDVNTLGFLPGAFFDLLAPEGSDFILGATFPFVWGDVDGNGTFIPSDVDRDGNLDYAFAEVWYNNAFTWTLTGFGGDADVQTVAFHENGHALGLAHFGKIHATSSPFGGRLHVSPRAAMNAVILGTLRAPLGTDNAALCGYYASWP